MTWVLSYSFELGFHLSVMSVLRHPSGFFFGGFRRVVRVWCQAARRWSLWRVVKYPCFFFTLLIHWSIVNLLTCVFVRSVFWILLLWEAFNQ